MTIEEAIERYTSNAEYERTHGNLQGCLEFRQLAEWLKDYKQLKEQESCDDCISRDKTIVQLNHLLSNFDDEGNLAIRKCIETIKSMPPVIPQPKMERWIEHINNGMHYIECPKCSSWFLRMYLTRNSYCPNCGAKMQEVEE